MRPFEPSSTVVHPCTSLYWQEVSGSKQYRVFHQENSKLKNVQGCTFFSDGIPAATENPQRIADTPPLYFCSRLVVSERTGMSVVSHNGDVFAPQKLTPRSVHGCTLLDRLFSKGLRKAYFQKHWFKNRRRIYFIGCGWKRFRFSIRRFVRKPLPCLLFRAF